MLGARRAIEIGTFTGYSSLAIASALPDGGELIACDVNEEWDGHRQALLAGGHDRRVVGLVPIGDGFDPSAAALKPTRDLDPL